jgi:hypothetical protein
MTTSYPPGRLFWVFLIAVGFCLPSYAQTQPPNSNPPGLNSNPPVWVYPYGGVYEFTLFVSRSSKWLQGVPEVYFNGERVVLGDSDLFKTYSTSGPKDPKTIEWKPIPETSVVAVRALVRDWPASVNITVQPVAAPTPASTPPPPFECEIKFARISPNDARAISAGVVAAIIFILWVLTAGFQKYKIGERSHGGWSQWLIDKATDSYSLSNLQFYVWTAVAVFGYAFLSICRSLVQGTFDFVDLPQGLPGLVGISGATSILASGVKSTVGSQGSGEVQPSWTDLLTSGGVVAPERVQYFVWTLVGAGAFLYNVWNMDPSTINTLPVVPQQFLQIMGISAAGYLGGKLARGQGPVIDQVIVAKKPQSSVDYTLTLQITGAGLSALASYQLQKMDEGIPRDVAVSPAPVGGNNPEILAKQSDYERTKFATNLKVTLQWAPETKINDLLSGSDPVTLIMYNPDGECSKAQFKPS